jgi:uncharacterized membrane protein YjjP (DUF1212 family)
MDYNKLVDTALLAGQILLESNAETYRVEDVMNRILDISELQTTEAIALTTGLFLTLDDPSMSPITKMKRIVHRDTNLSKIARVNMITRRLTEGKYTVEEAYESLNAIYETQYPLWMKNLSVSLLSAFFTLLLGGGIAEFLLAFINGGIMIITSKVEKRTGFGFFAHNIIYSCIVAAFVTIIKGNLLLKLNSDITITASIFPLVPGTAITNAFRDTLKGDYMSGLAKASEAIVIAISIAIGVAIGLVLAGGARL